MEEPIEFIEKYRPTELDDVLGQDHIINLIKKQIVNNKLSKYLIFSGYYGSGKTTLARVLLKILNCKYRKGYKPCNKCDHCKKINLRKGDLSFDSIIQIVDASISENLGDIESLIKEIYDPKDHFFTNCENILFIDEAHCLSKKIQNQFLHYLESTSVHNNVTVIFSTTNSSNIINPLRSRCLELIFNPIGNEIIISHLKNIINNEGITYNKGLDYYLELIAFDSKGSMRKAIKTLDNSIIKKNLDYTLVEGIINSISENEINKFILILSSYNIPDIVQYVKSIQNFEKYLNSLLIYIKIYFNENILLYTTLSNLLIDTVSEHLITNIDLKIIFIKNISIFKKDRRLNLNVSSKKDNNISVLSEILKPFIINKNLTEYELDYDEIKKYFYNNRGKKTDSSTYIKNIFLPALEGVNKINNTNIIYDKSKCRKEGKRLKILFLRKKD